MKIIFFGTPPFAASILKHLLSEEREVVAVVSKPDKPKGRSKKLLPTAVKEVALAEGLDLYQPQKASAPEFAETLAQYEADLFVVVAYGEIIKQHLLDMPKIACINIHASLLPKLRGAAPIHRAIIGGESKTGVTIMHMVRKMDAGEIILQKEVAIGENTTTGELTEMLCQLGCSAISEALDLANQGKLPMIPQDENKVTMAPKIELEECQVHWQRPSQDLHDLIRGANPAPGAWCEIEVRGEKKRMKLWRTVKGSGQRELGQPGSLLEYGNKSFKVACGEGSLDLLELQLEGKKRMDAQTFMLGVPQSEMRFLS